MQGLSSFRYCIFRVSCQSSQANSISISHLSVSAGLYVHTTSGFLRRFLAGWLLLLFTSRDISPKSSQHRTLCNSPSSCLSLSNAGITGVCQHFCLDLFSVVIVFFLYTGLYVALAGFKLKRSPAYASLSNGTKGECHHTQQSFLDSVQPVVITKVLQPTNPHLHPSSHLEGGSAPTVCPFCLPS